MFSHTALFALRNEEAAIKQAPEQKQLHKYYQPARRRTPQHRCPGKTTQVCYLWCMWLPPPFSVACLTRQQAWTTGALPCPEVLSLFLRRPGNAAYCCSMCGSQNRTMNSIICCETDFVHSFFNLEAYHHCCDTGRPCNGTVISRHD